MKKLILALCIILLPTPLWAGGMMIMGGGTPAAAPPAGEWFGPTAQDRAIANLSAYTLIDMKESCPKTGNVTAIKVYVSAGVTGAQFACFNRLSATHFSTTGYSEAVNLGAGLNTLTGGGVNFTSFACTAGNYPGVYTPAGGGNMDYSNSGGTMMANDNGDQIPCTDNIFGEDTSGWEMSLEFYVE